MTMVMSSSSGSDDDGVERGAAAEGRRKKREDGRAVGAKRRRGVGWRREEGWGRGDCLYSRRGDEAVRRQERLRPKMASAQPGRGERSAATNQRKDSEVKAISPTSCHQLGGEWTIALLRWGSNIDTGLSWPLVNHSGDKNKVTVSCPDYIPRIPSDNCCKERMVRVSTFTFGIDPSRSPHIASPATYAGYTGPLTVASERCLQHETGTKARGRTTRPISRTRSRRKATSYTAM